MTRRSTKRKVWVLELKPTLPMENTKGLPETKDRVINIIIIKT